MQFPDIDNLFNNFENTNFIDFYKNAYIIYENKENIEEILEYINKIMFSKLKNTNDMKYEKYIEGIEKAKRNLKANANFDMTIDNMLFNMGGER